METRCGSFKATSMASLQNTLSPSTITVSFLLLICNAWQSCVEASRFPVYCCSQSSPALEDYEDPDCFEDLCMSKNIHKLDPHGMSYMLNYLHRNQDEYGINDPIDKRNPPPEAQNIDSSSGTVLFRDANPTPCSCFSDSIERDLGRGVYPRYMKDLECNTTSCGNPLYRCHSLKREILVLTEKTQHTAPGEARLPISLRRRWTFEGVNITVACICQRHYSH